MRDIHTNIHTYIHTYIHTGELPQLPPCDDGKCGTQHVLTTIVNILGHALSGRYVCMYVCMCACVRASVCVYAYTQTYVCIVLTTIVNILGHALSGRYVGVCVCVYVYMYIYIYIYIYLYRAECDVPYFSQSHEKYKYTCLHTYTHRHIYIHIHTRRKWAKIFFSPYSVLYPLKNLAGKDSNLEILARTGVICSLARVMNEWTEGRQVSFVCVCVCTYIHTYIHTYCE